MKYCPECGAELQQETPHCPQCGANLASQTPRIRKVNPKQVIIIVMLIISAGLVYQYIYLKKDNVDVYENVLKVPAEEESSVKEKESSMDPRVYKLASSLKCLCGCDEPSLIVCKCEDTVEQLQYLKDAVAAGEAMDTIKKTYYKKFQRSKENKLIPSPLESHP